MRRLAAFLLLVIWAGLGHAAEPRLQDLRLGGLRTGMTVAEVRETIRGTLGASAVEETARADGAPWITQTTIRGETVVAFFSAAAKGSRVNRITASMPLGGRTAADIEAEWTKRFGTPSAVDRSEGKRFTRVGWGLRPGPEGSHTNIGPGPVRLLGEVSQTNKTISLTMVDDHVPD
jgi:hypothetical protein